MRALLVFMIYFSLAGLSLGQITVRSLSQSSDAADKQGFFYALPQTYIKVEIDVQKTEFKAGPYAEYASKYLGITDVTTADYSEYLILDAKLSTVPVPDPEHLYFVTVSDRISKDGKTVMLMLAESGLAIDVLGTLQEKSQKALSSLTLDYKDGARDLFRYYASANLVEQFDTIIRKVVVDTATIEKVYLDRRWVEKRGEQKAADAANEINKIRTARYNLLSGFHEVSWDAGAIVYMDEQLKKLEDEYLSLFMGIAQKKIFRYTFHVKPESDESKKVLPVFVFSERSGIKEASASGGDKIGLKIERTADYGPIQSGVKKRNETARDSQGFYYRLPVVSKVTLEISNDLKVEGMFPISQFGAVTYLPPNITTVQFHESTGAIRTIIAD
ncbi:MAG: DUF4831 family protein [Bacteroidales bacterium]